MRWRQTKVIYTLLTEIQYFEPVKKKCEVADIKSITAEKITY